MQPILQVENISKIYGSGETRVVAVDSVSLALSRQQVILIMGPSGSGKTTLLSMMGCILRPTSGAVYVDEQLINSLSEKQLPGIRRKYIGFVFQSFNLFPALTTLENVELVLKLKHVERSQVRNTALHLLEQVGLEKRTFLYPQDLSGGEKQRTALARALAGNPPIILG